MTASTVWILGAGFSRALGAPLFRDLFRSDHLVRASGLKLPEKTLRELLEVLSLYRRYAPGDLGGSVADVLWRDPEEFLDVAESARTQEGARAFLQTVTELSIEDLSDLGRRALAIECSHFLRGADVMTERWLPYRKWSGLLDGQHTIVTFNYDRVLEVLKAQLMKAGEAANHRVIVSGQGEGIAEEISHCRQRGVAPILKLHGSVDWFSASGKIVVDTAEDLPVKCKSGREIVLAIPGPGKAGVRKEFEEIEQLWSGARKAIGSTERVVFLGYRFPPTDAQARTEFLRALRDASREGKLKTVDIVLGPDRSDQDVVRMGELLKFACPPEVVHVRPLYVEDFLSLEGEW